MLLSMKAKYTLKALIVLAQNQGSHMSSRALSSAATIPHKFLDLILQELRQWGYISSVRGIHGGYSLSQSPEKIQLGNLLRKIDGPLAPIRCASLTAFQACDDCQEPEQCRVRHLMHDVRNAIANILDQRCLSDLLSSDTSFLLPT